MKAISLRPWTAGLIVAVSCFGVQAVAQNDRLRPPDASSPRATLEGFTQITDDIYKQMLAILGGYAHSEKLYLTRQEQQDRYRAVADALKAVHYLDLSRIAPVLRDTVAPERALQLREILDRIELPPMTDVPDQQAVASRGLKRWRLPDTEIDLVLVERGAGPGEFLVSAETVDRLPEFYQRVKDLPYKQGPAAELSDLYRSISGGRTTTLFDAFVSSPIGLSYILPPRWILSLPDWTRYRIADVTLWQWSVFGLGLAIGVLVIYGGHRLGRRAGADDLREQRGATWPIAALPLAVLLVAALLVPSLAMLLRIGSTPRIVIAYTDTALVYVAAAWLTIVMAVVMGEAVVRSERLSASALDSQLVRLGARLAGLVIAIALLVQGGDQLGLPAYSVLAGLGVGGIAVALAAQSTIANLIGSLLIAVEKPFRVGHSVRIGGSEGTVEDVGFRSTRIRTLDNSLLIIPSSTVVSTTVENLSLRTKRRQRFFVQVTYDTPREKIEEVVARIRQIILDHPMTEDSTCHVRLNNLSESSLDILVVFHLHVEDFATELREREGLLLHIMALLEETSVKFAFPTRTLQIEEIASTHLPNKLSTPTFPN